MKEKTERKGKKMTAYLFAGTADGLLSYNGSRLEKMNAYMATLDPQLALARSFPGLRTRACVHAATLVVLGASASPWWGLKTGLTLGGSCEHMAGNLEVSSSGVVREVSAAGRVAAERGTAAYHVARRVVTLRDIARGAASP
ncbi:hypothetical protein Cni_G25320 [Canna indica]|uniref:Uncharacterized protein n=1 Tax=Canna indica TaxID=4628 RepID=A0AAQ3KWS8_9LILI|nr:hypothetical protein Cni_G25320 [Canna indica]